MSYHVICGACRKSHYGQQIWNDDLQDYVCINCISAFCIETPIVEFKGNIVIKDIEINKEQPMEVNIELDDIRVGGKKIKLSNSENRGHVVITIGSSPHCYSAEVRIEDLRTALRKISAN